MHQLLSTHALQMVLLNPDKHAKTFVGHERAHPGYAPQ